MSSLSTTDPSARIAGELVRLLHQDAPADDFALCLAQAEALNEAHPGRLALVETVRMAMAVRNRLELQQQREHGMLAVIESAQELSSRLELTAVLNAIVRRARKLLDSNVAWLSVHDAVRGEFHVLVADGATSLATAGMVARHDRGVVSVVMSTRLPFATPDYLHDKRFVHDAQLDDTFRAEGIAALVGVPLIWDNEVIGLLFVADRYHRTHGAQSLAILCTLATHAAAALKNARDFDRLDQARRHADEARAELEHHMRAVQAAADAHEQMTSLLARGASLAALCQAVAQLLGGALLVLDEAAQVVGQGVAVDYAGALAQQYAPHGERSAALHAALRESRRSGRSVPAYQVGEGASVETCRVMPVIGGDDVLGAIALFHTGVLAEITVRTFERSSSVIGIVLLSQERTEATRSRGVAALLRALLSPRQDDPAVLLDQAGRHGMNLAQSLSLLVLDVSGPMDATGPGAAYAARRLRAMAPLAGTLVDEVDGLLVLLCGTTRAAEVREAVSAWARCELAGGYRGVLSRPISGPAEVPDLFVMLKRALGVLGRLGLQGQVIGQNEMALYSALFETHDQASLATYLEATIGPLLAHDRKRGTELAATLLRYFDANQNAKVTAQRLGIHVNTVRQRLTTIEDLLGHWGQAARALEIHIALRLWSLATPVP